MSLVPPAVSAFLFVTDDALDPVRVSRDTRKFLAAIRGEIPIPVTGEDGIAAVRVARALLQSAETHQVTDIRP